MARKSAKAPALTHIDASGEARMVDVSAKPATERVAVAEGRVMMSKATLELSNLGRMPVALYPGMRICSFTFEQLSTRVTVSYRNKKGNKYAGQDRPLASKLASESGK